LQTSTTDGIQRTLTEAVGAVARAMLRRAMVAQAGTRAPSGNSALTVAATEVVRLLSDARPAGAGELATELAARDAEVAGALAELRAWLPAGLPRLAALLRAAALGDVELAIITALLAPELDAEFERAYAYAMDDFSRKRPDLGLLARLLAADGDRGRALVRTHLAWDAPLRRARLVLVAGTDDQGPGAHRQVRVADRLVAHLQGDDRADERISAAVRVVPPRPLGELVLEDDLQRALRRTIDAGAGGKLLLIGKAGSGRATAAAAIAGELGHVAVKVDLAALAAEPAALAEPLALALREGLLRGGVTILDGEELPADLPRRTCQLIADACDAARGPLVLLWPSAPAWLSQGVGGLAELEVRPPSFARRVELWRRQLPAGTPADTLEVLASRYAFTPAAIALAARRALATARMRGEPTPTMDELADAARQQFGNRLGSVAQRIPTGFSWSDLVLPADTGAAVKEFITFARRRAFLLEEWGFAKKLPYGRGVSAILAGPPGTGKTMAAQLIAQRARRASCTASIWRRW
jgi:hypothetical protein